MKMNPYRWFLVIALIILVGYFIALLIIGTEKGYY